MRRGPDGALHFVDRLKNIIRRAGENIAATERQQADARNSGPPQRGNRTDDQGTWRFGAGTYHHFAWNLGSLENQEQVKFEIEGAGFLAVSLQEPGGAILQPERLRLLPHPIFAVFIFVAWLAVAEQVTPGQVLLAAVAAALLLRWSAFASMGPDIWLVVAL